MLSRVVIACLLSAVASSAALADTTSGRITSYDRQTQIIVLSDKTVWSLKGSEDAAPADLKPGENVVITYTSRGDDGIVKVNGLKRVTN